MALTAANLRLLLASIAEAGAPVTLGALKARHPCLSGDVGRGTLRLAMAGLAVMRRQGETLEVAVTPAGTLALGARMICLGCGMGDPPPDPTCHQGLDHYVGLADGCPGCGRLLIACARRPCSAWRGTE